MQGVESIENGFNVYNERAYIGTASQVISTWSRDLSICHFTGDVPQKATRRQQEGMVKLIKENNKYLDAKRGKFERLVITGKRGVLQSYEEQHSKGFITVGNLPVLKNDDDIGIKISEDGRVWICINGISFIRFKPKWETYDGKSK